MTHPVLVAYATKYGSTQEVAEAIATILRERGCEVAEKLAATLQPVASGAIQS